MRPTERLTSEHAALLVVDVQEKLVPPIQGRELMIANTLRLVRGAGILEIPTWATEQYPKGLGPTVPELATHLPDRWAKTTFHCGEVPSRLREGEGRTPRHVTLAGIEAHVCIAQTALELMDRGYRVQVAADAVASRSRFDWEIGLRRLEAAGAVVSTTEAILFEWTESSHRPEFKAISALIKSFVPPEAERADRFPRNS